MAGLRAVAWRVRGDQVSRQDWVSWPLCQPLCCSSSRCGSRSGRTRPRHQDITSCFGFPRANRHARQGFDAGSMPAGQLRRCFETVS